MVSLHQECTVQFHELAKYGLPKNVLPQNGSHFNSKGCILLYFPLTGVVPWQRHEMQLGIFSQPGLHKYPTDASLVLASRKEQHLGVLCVLDLLEQYLGHNWLCFLRSQGHKNGIKRQLRQRLRQCRDLTSDQSKGMFQMALAEQDLTCLTQWFPTLLSQGTDF